MRIAGWTLGHITVKYDWAILFTVVPWLSPVVRALKTQGMEIARKRKMRHFCRERKCKERKMQQSICIIAGVAKCNEWKMERKKRQKMQEMAKRKEI